MLVATTKPLDHLRSRPGGCGTAELVNQIYLTSHTHHYKGKNRARNVYVLPNKAVCNY